MGERTEDCGHDEQDEDDDGDEISKYDSWPTTSSQRSIGDQNCNKRIHGSKSVSDGRILVNLGDSIDQRLMWFVVRFEPEDERSGGLTAEGLHR